MKSEFCSARFDNHELLTRREKFMKMLLPISVCLYTYAGINVT
jgi:hypothetical protein